MDLSERFKKLGGIFFEMEEEGEKQSPPTPAKEEVTPPTIIKVEGTISNDEVLEIIGHIMGPVDTDYERFREMDKAQAPHITDPSARFTVVMAAMKAMGISTEAIMASLKENVASMERFIQNNSSKLEMKINSIKEEYARKEGQISSKQASNSDRIKALQEEIYSLEEENKNLDQTREQETANRDTALQEVGHKKAVLLKSEIVLRGHFEKDISLFTTPS